MLYPGISLEGMVQGYRDQYLLKKGWLRSAETRRAVDMNGEPVPWLTYPASDFLARALKPEWKVFEFGSGSSTAWWSRRISQVHSVEHDANWHHLIRPQCTENAQLSLISAGTAPHGVGKELVDHYFEEVPEAPMPADQDFQMRAGICSDPFRAYAAEIVRFPPGYFDVVVIDGMARALTTWLTVRHARPKSFIVFDNSDRDIYAQAYDCLKGAGYHRIDFWGSGPINPYEWCTSVFLRSVHPLP